VETDPNFIMAILSNPYVSIVTAVITLGAAISAAFPSKLGKDTWFGKALQLILDIGNFAGLNFGKAKNADDA
jgi:hypothetical protein